MWSAQQRSAVDRFEALVGIGKTSGPILRRAVKGRGESAAICEGERLQQGGGSGDVVGKNGKRGSGLSRNLRGDIRRLGRFPRDAAEHIRAIDEEGERVIGGGDDARAAHFGIRGQRESVAKIAFALGKGQT